MFLVFEEIKFDGTNHDENKQSSLSKSDNWKDGSISHRFCAIRISTGIENR